MKESGKHYNPLVLEIKEHMIQSIENILDKKYRAWKLIPIKDLVIIIDGLDEAPTDEFVEIGKHLFEFSLSYPAINIVFSCRKLFFNDYSLSTIVKGFDFYDLCPLQYNDIITHVEKTLPKRKDEFIELTKKKGIYELLYYPFYLIEFVNEFPNNLPNSRITALKNVIERSFSRSENRNIGNGQLLRHKKVASYSAIQKLAFALQLAGLNSFDNEAMERLFDDKEIGLLRHNSLVSISNDKWSFINAMFQEHLAALMLSCLPFDQIVSPVTVGKSIKKIKIKWIQTFSSLLSLTAEKDLFDRLLNLLREDNIQLIFLTEKSKYERAFRFEMLQEILKQCIHLNIRPNVVRL